jgi:hypothetical protein
LDLVQMAWSEPEPVVPASTTASSGTDGSHDVLGEAVLRDLQRAGSFLDVLSGAKRRSRGVRSDAQRYVDVVFALDEWQVR